MDFLKSTSTVTARQFGFFRVAFGLYLIWHFASLIPYGIDLFSSQGVMGDPSLNPFSNSWPNPLFNEFSHQWITPWLCASVIASLLFTIGHLRRLSALFLWFSMSSLFTANPLIANPSLGYVGLLLLLTLLIPTGEDFCLKKQPHPDWKMPKMIPLTAWILLASGYSFSGILKLSSPSWLDGSALLHILENPLARPGFIRDLLLTVPDFLLKWATWATLALEVLFIPLALFNATRRWAWLLMLLIHIAIMITIDFADLSLAMIIVHLFTYQHQWLPTRFLTKEEQVGSDRIQSP